MSQLGTEFKVGLFTLIGVSAIIASFFFLSPDLFERTDKAKYYTVLKDASGIMPKTHIKTNGVTVGKVTSVELDINATKVVFEIRGDIKVPVGSSIEVRSVGFLGDKFLEINRAEDSGTYIEHGGLIPRTPDSSDLNQVISLVGEIAKDIKKVTANLASTLGSEDGKESIAIIVKNIEDISSDLRNIIRENRHDVRQLVKNIKDFSHSFKNIVSQENQDRINQILLTLEQSMTEVEGASRNINLISEKVEKGEGTIGKLINDDQALNEIEGAIKDLRKVLSPVSQLQVVVDYHGEMRTDDSTQNYFNLNLHTRPGSHYVLGLTDLGVETKETKTIQNQDENVTKEEIKQENALRFNLQIARRWHWIGVRFGLFESTGGIASDFYLLDDKLKLSLEAFDFSDKDEKIRDTAHVKLYASILFFNHIYTMIGIDDPTKNGEDTNFFLGAGISFNDQDLKALFGIASLASP